MILKTIKVSKKGQIAIPRIIRRVAHIEEGDELIIIEENGKILIEKSTELTKQVKEDFSEMLKHSEDSLKEVWDNPQDDLWSEYLK